VRLIFLIPALALAQAPPDPNLLDQFRYHHARISPNPLTDTADLAREARLAAILNPSAPLAELQSAQTALVRLADLAQQPPFQLAPPLPPIRPLPVAAIRAKGAAGFETYELFRPATEIRLRDARVRDIEVSPDAKHWRLVPAASSGRFPLPSPARYLRFRLPPGVFLSALDIASTTAE
jgi:hypothetical protein